MAAPKYSDQQVASYVARTKWLQTLFTLTATGAVQAWKIGTLENEVVSMWGQNGGAQQITVDALKEGKNLGKKNETTSAQQAEIKAKQLWDKKIKDGYQADIEKAKAGESNLEGVDPMLAFPIEDKEKYVTFPALAQPKLDGFRCIAMIKNGSVRLFSRTRKEIKTLPHIVEELSAMFGNKTLILDGELYNHSLKSDFNKIASTIKRDEVHPDHKIIQYHIYDVVDTENSYNQRLFDVKEHIIAMEPLSIKLVDTYTVNDRASLNKMHDMFCVEGFEGAMYRSSTGGYEQKRSPTLLKVKRFQDQEFEIVGKVEGNGKFAGKLGAFICTTSQGKVFNVAMNGELETLEEYLENFEDYKGRDLQVQFQGLTPDGIPRFPRGLRIRIDE